jgi:diguanylate cyclase (GGDEF)-like protein
MKSGTPLWVADTDTAGSIGRLCGVIREIAPRSLIVLPFSAQGEIVGCLEMNSEHSNRFDRIEYHLAFLVAAHLSSALENVLTKQELTNANSRLKDHDQQLMELNRKLRELAHTDEATGLFNKRRLFERLDMEIARARRYGEILTCLMLDIDDFKKINDTYGHQAGDEILRQIGLLLQNSLRVTDFVARYGGEEFTVLLPRTNSAGAATVAENLRKKFMLHAFTLPAMILRLTVSIGVACCTTFDRLDAQQIIQRADNALYRAKRAGKNRASFACEAEPPCKEVRILSNLSQSFDTGIV